MRHLFRHWEMLTKSTLGHWRAHPSGCTWGLQAQGEPCHRGPAAQPQRRSLLWPPRPAHRPQWCMGVAPRGERQKPDLESPAPWAAIARVLVYKTSPGSTPLLSHLSVHMPPTSGRHLKEWGAAAVDSQEPVREASRTTYEVMDWRWSPAPAFTVM